MKILIAGGGIGGLTAALCGLHFGHDVTVLERASELGDVGAGIQVPPNAMKVFEALGVADKIASKAFRPEAIETRMGVSGRPIFTIPLAEHALTSWGSPYLHIHRADYIDVLRQALLDQAPEALRLGASVQSYRQDEASVSVELTDGQEIAGDVLIGADGIKSVVRHQMLGADKPVFTRNVAWRAVVPVSALGGHLPNPTACAWMGAGKHGVTYYLRGGELVNFVGVVEQDGWSEEGWAVKGQKDDLLRDFAGWHPVITSLLNSVDPDQLFKWALFDREPLSTWVDGRVALMGDAAHPMLPFLAQGAAMAVEDAWVLASELTETQRSFEASLNAYQTTRYKRASKVQSASRGNMKIFHQRRKLGQIKTYGPMWLAGKVLPSVVHKRMNWVYGFDVTKP